MVKPIPPKIPAPTIFFHFKSVGKVQSPKPTPINDKCHIPSGFPITSPASIPRLFESPKPLYQLLVSTIPVLAIANKGRIKKATGLCKKCCSIKEGDFSPPSPNGITKANNTPVMIFGSTSRTENQTIT